MKSKRSKTKLELVLNKKTIANLNHQEMVKVGGGLEKRDFLNVNGPESMGCLNKDTDWDTGFPTKSNAKC